MSEPDDADTITSSRTIGPHLETLPDAVHRQIASYLTIPDALSLSTTSRALLDAGESRMWYSVNLRFARSTGGFGQKDHFVSHVLREEAQTLGDTILVDGQVTVDLLQGGLRFYARLLNRRPNRRNWIKEIVADCTKHGEALDQLSTGTLTARRFHRPAVQVVVGQQGGTISDDDGTKKDEVDISRTFRSLSTLRSVISLTLHVIDAHQGDIRRFLTLTPNVQHLSINHSYTGYSPPSTVSWPVLPKLRVLTIGHMKQRVEPLAANCILKSRELRSVAMIDWPGSWRPALDSPVVLSLKGKKNRINKLCVPTIAFDLLDPQDLRNIHILGLQGPYHPSFRLLVSSVYWIYVSALIGQDVTIPTLPRLNLLVFFLDRASTLTPFQAAKRLSSFPDPCPVGHLPRQFISQIEAAPQLVNIHLANAIGGSSLPIPRAQIRTFTRPGETLTHVRVFSSQIWTGEEKWGMVVAEERNEVWQDWTDYRGKVVPLEMMKRIYELGGVDFQSPKRTRGMSLPEKAWKLLESSVGSVG